MMLKKIILPLLLLGALTGQAQTKKSVPAKKPAVKAKPAVSARPAAPATGAMKTQTDSLSYAMGVSVGSFLKSQGIDKLNYAMLNKAIEQAFKGSASMDMNQANEVMKRAAMAGSTRAASAEKEKGRAFLLQNKKKAGITETASGLQYEVLVAGQGPKPTQNDTIVVHYAGKLLSGKEFDSSYSRGEPIHIPVSGVIAGWTEAVQLMPTGSKWRLYIPSSLAYGDNAAGPDIPGGATLVFDVELLEIANRKK
ncbi:MAG: FKBP-type peptidyl-prolyl cis-trans isomerase [Adhaeribacter sp.]